MYHKILETDEAIEDVHHISCEAYNYTRDKDSGLTFLKLYDATTANMAMFPNGFSATDIEYRGEARKREEWRSEYMKEMVLLMDAKEEGREEERENTERERQRADSESRRADNESQRADRAEARVKELEALLAAK